MTPSPFLLLHYLGIRKLEAFFAALIATMAVCFFINFAEVAPPARDIASGFIPYFHQYAAFQAVGIIGAVMSVHSTLTALTQRSFTSASLFIFSLVSPHCVLRCRMPHNMFLHSALVQSRAIDRSRPAKVREANFYFSIESGVALFVSFIINLVVVCVFAAAFFDPTCAAQGKGKWPETGECEEIGLAEAGDALKSALGGAAQTVWAIGLLAAGQSSTMTGTYAGQFVFNGFFDLQIAPWKRVAITRSIALVPAVLVALLSASNGSLADTLDQYLNILQSVQLPFAVLPLLRFTSSASIMGAFVNSRWLSAAGWSLSLLFIISNFYLIGDFLVTPDSPIPHAVWFYVVVGIVGVAYVTFIVYIIWEDILQAWDWARGRKGRERLWETKHSSSLLSTHPTLNGDSDERKTGDGEEEPVVELEER